MNRDLNRSFGADVVLDGFIDREAQVFDLTPGRMVTWAQNAPHRIENGPMLNVSLSIEFMTPPALPIGDLKPEIIAIRSFINL